MLVHDKLIAHTNAQGGWAGNLKLQRAGDSRSGHHAARIAKELRKKQKEERVVTVSSCERSTRYDTPPGKSATQSQGKSI